MSWVRVQLGKVTALGVLCCFALFVCLTLLASFFLPSHLSFKNMYMYLYIIIIHLFITFSALVRTPTFICMMIQTHTRQNIDMCL